MDRFVAAGLVKVALMGNFQLAFYNPASRFGVDNVY